MIRVSSTTMVRVPVLLVAAAAVATPLAAADGTITLDRGDVTKDIFWGLGAFEFIT